MYGSWKSSRGVMFYSEYIKKLIIRDPESLNSVPVDGLIKRTSSMLNEITSITVHKDKESWSKKTKRRKTEWRVK